MVGEAGSIQLFYLDRQVSLSLPFFIFSYKIPFLSRPRLREDIIERVVTLMIDSCSRGQYIGCFGLRLRVFVAILICSSKREKQ